MNKYFLFSKTNENSINKRIYSVLIALIVFGTMPMILAEAKLSDAISPHQELIIRKEIYWLCENHSRISLDQFAQDGLSLHQVIDRDIRILNSHIDLLEKKVERAKGPLARYYLTPIKNYIGYSVSAGSAAIATYLSLCGVVSLIDCLKNEKLTEKMIAFIGTFFRPRHLRFAWSQLSAEFSADQIDIRWFVGLLFFAPVVALVSTSQFVKYDHALTHHEQLVKMQVNKIKARILRDREALAVLKNMKKQIV